MGVKGSKVRLMDVNNVWIKVQICMPFQIGSRHGLGWHQGVYVSYGCTNISEKGAGGIVSVGISRSELTIVQVDQCPSIHFMII